MTGILIRRGKFRQTDTERRTEADVEPMHLQDEEHQALPVTTKNWEISMTQILHRASKKGPMLLTP